MPNPMQAGGSSPTFQISAKYMLLGFLVFVAANPVQSQKRQRPNPCVTTTSAQTNLPALHVIQDATLGPSYSCGGNGYGSTALFLSDYSKQENGPELVFNGACGGPDYFDVNTSGDDMSLIADLGNIPLTAVTAENTFNLQRVNSFSDYTQFAQVAKVVQGHTYAAVINTRDVRGLFVFTVAKFVPDQEVDIQFDVKDYQINLGPFEISPGFAWNQ
jgi:hypothetical protein